MGTGGLLACTRKVSTHSSIASRASGDECAFSFKLCNHTFHRQTRERKEILNSGMWSVGFQSSESPIRVIIEMSRSKWVSPFHFYPTFPGPRLISIQVLSNS